MIDNKIKIEKIIEEKDKINENIEVKELELGYKYKINSIK